jgi:trigger factor
MKVTIETINAVEKKLNFEIPPERVGEEMEKMYRSLQLSTRIKGFRAGKAPRVLVERQFGEQVAAEVGAHLVEESYAQAIDEHRLPVVTPPRVVAEKMTPGQPFRYSAMVEVRPEVSVVNHEGIEAEKQVRQVQEKELEDALTRLAESFAQLHPVGDRVQVENGDVVRLDFAAFVNGKPVPGLQSKGRLIEMGKEIIFPGFQERILGAKKGSLVEFSLPFPEGQADETPLNRQADFRVTVHELLCKEVPQLDDEFAKDHGECDTLTELREKVRQNLQEALDRRAEAQLEEAILTQLVDRNPFEVPPSLVREQERRMLIEAGILRPEEDLSAGQAALPEQLREEFSARARRQVQTFLLLDALAKQLNVVVSEEETQKRIEDIIAANGIERREQIEALYERPENRSSLERRLQQEKTLRLVTDKAQVKVVEKSVPKEEAGVAGAEEKD